MSETPPPGHPRAASPSSGRQSNGVRSNGHFAPRGSETPDDVNAYDPELVTSPGHGGIGVFQAPSPVRPRGGPAAVDSTLDIDSPFLDLFGAATRSGAGRTSGGTDLHARGRLQLRLRVRRGVAVRPVQPARRRFERTRRPGAVRAGPVRTGAYRAASGRRPADGAAALRARTGHRPARRARTGERPPAGRGRGGCLPSAGRASAGRADSAGGRTTGVGRPVHPGAGRAAGRLLRRTGCA